ncbi:MAG: neutral zinc metallopeptidase [Propionicimonas sp.]
MTQQWGTQGQPPQGGQQWPTQQNWNRPAQAWGPQQPYGPPAPAYGPYPGGQPARPAAPYPQQAPAPQPAYPAQAQFGQPSYGPPGTFPQPVRPYPPGPPQKKSPLRGLVLGLVLVVGIAFFAISLMQYLNADPGVAGPDVNQTTAPVPQNTTPVPAPDTNPPELPQPTTYEEAETWLVSNPVYEQIAPVPTDCAVPRIDITTASAADLTTHLNELTACLWRVWSGPLESAGFQLPRPPVTVYTEPITTGCGNLDEVNAVYCAADQRIYYARPLWKIFPPEQQKAPFVVESILAHEFGHTIQARTGILISSMAFEQKASTSEAKVFSRRLEVQADCLAGTFTSAVGPSSGLSGGDLSNLRDVFYNLGDDVLSNQANIQGDHGLGRSRKAWFTVGQDNTLVGKCNTYTAPATSVR